MKRGRAPVGSALGAPAAPLALQTVIRAADVEATRLLIR
jgi:hypothetical protein